MGMQLSPGSRRRGGLAASGRGLGPRCSPLPAAGHGVAPLHPCLRGLLATESPLRAWEDQPSPPRQQLAQGPSYAQHQGLPGDAVGPLFPPTHTHPEARSWGSRPWLGAAFSLVLKNLPGETISSDPKT